MTRRRSSGFERARSPTTPTRSSSTSSPPPPPRTAVTPHRARRKETLTIHLILRRIYTLHRARSRLRLARPDSHSFDAFMDATRFMYLVTDDAKSPSSVLARIDTSARASPRPHSSSDRAFPPPSSSRSIAIHTSPPPRARPPPPASPTPSRRASFARTPCIDTSRTRDARVHTSTAGRGIAVGTHSEE